VSVLGLLVLLGLLSPLLVLLVGGLGVVIVRQRARLRRLEADARQDLLTGLPNRRGLAAHWEAMAGPKALMLIDLVGFKAVNDSHGHIVGDALLRQVAARLGAAVPPPGVLARWGGDEFAAVIPADRADAQQALIANARAMAYDLSASGGPGAVRIGARTGLSAGETELAAAVAAAARQLMEAKGASG
jgi:diguanylate cyclase (GGDEF)-like protein